MSLELLCTPSWALSCVRSWMGSQPISASWQEWGKKINNKVYAKCLAEVKISLAKKKYVLSG